MKVLCKPKSIISILCICVIFIGACIIFCACDNQPDGGETPSPIVPSEPGYDYTYKTYTVEGVEYLPTEQIPSVEYGTTTRISYYSDTAQATKHATVNLPASYDGIRHYPVLYLLHGLLGNEYSWFDECNAAYIAANTHCFEGVKEMIIVGVNCIVNADEKEPSWSSTELTKIYDMTGEDIIEDLMPYINSNYLTLTDRHNTALAGYSMGGRETMLVGFEYAEYFGYLGAFSSANFAETILTASTLIPSFRLPDGCDPFEAIMLNIGVLDFMTGGVTQNLHNSLSMSGIEHIYYSMIGGHDSTVWQNGLYNFCTEIFK